MQREKENKGIECLSGSWKFSKAKSQCIALEVMAAKANFFIFFFIFFFAVPLNASQALACPIEDTVLRYFSHLCAYHARVSVVKASESVRLLVQNTFSRSQRKGKNKAKSGFRALFCQWTVTSCEFNKSLTEPVTGKENSGESPGF